MIQLFSESVGFSVQRFAVDFLIHPTSIRTFFPPKSILPSESFSVFQIARLVYHLHRLLSTVHHPRCCTINLSANNVQRVLAPVLSSSLPIWRPNFSPAGDMRVRNRFPSRGNTTNLRLQQKSSYVRTASPRPTISIASTHRFR